MVYFIGHPSGYIKIGHARRVRDRLSTLQVSSPELLTLVAVMNGGRTEEQAVHQKLSQYKRSGEWFVDCDQVRKFIADNEDTEAFWRLGFGVSEEKHGVWIRRIKNEQDLTFSDIGERLGITSQSAKEMETREAQGKISINMLRKVATALGYKLEYRFVKLPLTL